MGAESSHPKKPLTRSVSFNGSQRDIYRDFDVQLFKIDCEIKFTPELECAKISEIKERLYCLRKEFDASRMKDKYEVEFRCKYRRAIENLERRSQVKETQVVKKKSRKKRLAPLPPETAVSKEIEDLQNEIKQLKRIVPAFRGRRDGDKHQKLKQAILALLFKLTSLETGSDNYKYGMVKELLDMLKQLEDKAVENDETAVNSD